MSTDDDDKHISKDEENCHILTDDNKHISTYDSRLYHQNYNLNILINN